MNKSLFSVKHLIFAGFITMCCISLLTGCSCVCQKESAAVIKNQPQIHWRADTTKKYLHDDKVTTLICVKVLDGSNANMLMFEKSRKNGKTIWTKTLECPAYIGKDGLGKTKEGDNLTPRGDFGLIQAFGIKENPGTKLQYTNVTDSTYCCGDETAYNRIIDIKKIPHNCINGEHLIEYTPEYNYGIFFDYNRECEFGKGSALFIHCKGGAAYTGGCIAIDEAFMVQVLQAVDANSRLIIDYAE